jgi:hypothetical protein
MDKANPHCPQTLRSPIALTVGLLMLTGCATTQMGAQYADPQFPPQALRGATILVVCEAPETAIRLICEREIASHLAQLGAKPHIDTSLVNPTPGREPDGRQYLPAARAAGAQAVFSAALRQEPWQANPLPWLNIGIGNWSWSGGGGVAGGVGISMPVGSAQGGIGLAAVASINETANGRMMWTAKATTPGAEASLQISELAKALAESAKQSGLF